MEEYLMFILVRDFILNDEKFNNNHDLYSYLLYQQ